MKPLLAATKGLAKRSSYSRVCSAISSGVYAAEDDLDRALGAHHRDLGGRPGIVQVAAQMLRRHDVVGPAIGLARDHRDLRHRRLGIGEQQLRAMLDDAVMLLAHARQEARHVDEGQDRNVERVAEADEARALLRRVDVEAAGQHHRLVGDDADGPTLDPAEADDDVGGMGRLKLEEIALVGDLPDQLVHVIGRCRRRRDERVETVLDPVPRILESAARAMSWRLDSGRKSKKSRVASSASMSFSNATSATPDLVVWVTAPPSSSWVTTSLVTVFTTSGPVTNM